MFKIGNIVQFKNTYEHQEYIKGFLRKNSIPVDIKLFKIVGYSKETHGCAFIQPMDDSYKFTKQVEGLGALVSRLELATREKLELI